MRKYEAFKSILSFFDCFKEFNDNRAWVIDSIFNMTL